MEYIILSLGRNLQNALNLFPHRIKIQSTN